MVEPSFFLITTEQGRNQRNNKWYGDGLIRDLRLVIGSWLARIQGQSGKVRGSVDELDSSCWRWGLAES
jgi:hypothetical protein